MRKAIWAVGLAAVFGFICGGPGVVDAQPAQATLATEQYCPTWKLQSAAGEYPEVSFGEAPAGAKVNGKSKVTLVKPTEGVMPGTEFAAYTMDLSFDEPVSITVDYELNGGASHAAGAVRMFYYENQNADTLFVGPTGKAEADAEHGTLTITGVSKVGTLGLVYDGSNAAGGSVVFTDLRVGNVPVKFTDVCTEPSPTPTVTASASPSPTPTATGGATAAPTPTRTVAAGAGGGSLPVTGSKPVYVAGAAAVIVVAGLALVLAARRRKTKFTA